MKFDLNHILAAVQILTLLGLWVYVIITRRIAVLTSQSVMVSQGILQEMKDSRDAENAPYVVVYFQIERSADALYLIVKNIGKSIARNVKLHFNPPIRNTEKSPQHSVQNIADSPLIKNGIETMPPGFEVRLVLDRAQRYITASLSTQGFVPIVYYVRVTYGGDTRSDVTTVNYTLDLNLYRGFLEA